MSYQRDFKNKIRLAVLGVGSHCYRNIMPALHYLPVDLVSVCDLNEESGLATAKEYGCKYYQDSQTMYKSEELDAVVICVSPQLHPKLACEAFDCGLHVWLEKPPAMRVAEIEEMLSHRKDRVCVVGFKKIFMPGATKAKEIMEAKKYGDPISILAVYPMSIPPDGEKILKEGTVTNWLGNSCHPLSFMLYLGGDVGAVTTYRNKTAGGEGGLLVIEFTNGIIGNFHFASGPQPSEAYSVFGKSWHLHIDNSRKITLHRGIPFAYGKTTNYAPEGDDTGAIVWEPQNCIATLENKALFTQGMYFELKHFCDCILNSEKASLGTLEFAKEVMKVYEAALLSSGNRIVINGK